MYAEVASPSSTFVGPEMLMVMGSLSAMVADAELAPFLRETWSEMAEVISPRATVKLSAPSDNSSSIAVMVMDWLEPASLFAGKVTVPPVVPRSAAFAESVPKGALHSTRTAASTDLDNVTVKTALFPSETGAEGPVMLSSTCSFSPGGMAPWSLSVSVTVAVPTVSPGAVVLPTR